MRKITNFATRDEFLTTIFKKGVLNFQSLHRFVDEPGQPITDLDEIIDMVINAEECGILFVKKNKSQDRSSYSKNIRWYMGRLERDKKIKGFTGVVGRPKGSTNSCAKALEALQGLLN